MHSLNHCVSLNISKTTSIYKQLNYTELISKQISLTVSSSWWNIMFLPLRGETDQS